MDFLDAIRRESDAFYAAADNADPRARVAACPEWDVADLVWHLAEVHWFWGSIVDQRLLDRGDAEKSKPARPDRYEELVALGRRSAERMLTILAANDDATPVWTWALDPSDHSVGFIRRHQVQEVAVHRWDLQRAATGAADAIEPATASDSIDEVLDITLPWSVNAEKPMTGSVHIHCTDVEGEWFIHPDGRVEPIHAKGDVAIRGSASDVLLALYNRIDVSDLDVIGDAELARRLCDALG